jgi:hypothetical protein
MPRLPFLPPIPFIIGIAFGFIIASGIFAIPFAIFDFIGGFFIIFGKIKLLAPIIEGQPRVAHTSSSGLRRHSAAYAGRLRRHSMGNA